METAKSEEPASKMQKIEENAHQISKNGKSDDAKRFHNFEVTKVLNENSKSKMICLLGHFENEENGTHKNNVQGDGDCKEKAVVILEKTPISHENATAILTDQSETKQDFKNDIYHLYQTYPSKELNGVKTTLIYPATEKHIAKYSAQEMFVVEESPEDYEKVTLPYIEQSHFSIEWVFNILEKKKESERIVFEDTDAENGFILLPDMKWNAEQIEDLYLIGIIHRRGVKSIRELTADHLPLLKNIRDKGITAIKEKYGVPKSKLRIYLHYQPSYYHLHVHFTHLRYDAPGSGTEKAHLLSDVIDNLELDSSFYQKKTLTCVLRENEGLYKAFKEAGRV